MAELIKLATKIAGVMHEADHAYPFINCLPGPY